MHSLTVQHKQGGATWQKSATWILLSTTATGMSAEDVEQNQSGEAAE